MIELADNLAVDVREVVKDFRVYHRSFGTLKGQLASWVKEKVLRQAGNSYTIKRALDNVSFSIEKGQSVALIGHNGSGKSTLLSILSKVYLPTSGTALLRGGVISLLELGAGFHSELTARENVFFSGAIRGLSDSDVAAIYDEIVAFAELDKNQMDIPVRMFSSGMLLRLAFAVSVHLDAHILLIDEGLAVGDEAFQEKCFAKIAQFRSEGKTLVMVSHELDHVERVADRVLWLDHGRLKRDGAVDEVLAEYREAMAASKS
jgi:ABC-type polysaccharide/polyol phosphate transport system ATPase subunit